MIRLVAIDLDGTLLSPDKTISPANKQALLDAEAAGVHVVICTGRPLERGAVQFLKKSASKVITPTL